LAANRALTRFAVLSIAAALVTLALKFGAYVVTGSVGLLSDAMESLVNLAAAFMVLAMLSLAARPPDEEHAYGHEKAEYFASSFEGALILVAAGSIAWTAVRRLLHPVEVEQVGLGVAIAVAAAMVNLGAALLLRGAGRRHGSIALEADAQHLLSDVVTSAGVVAGLAATDATGWLWLDPVIALLVAANVVRIGVDLMRRSALGLLDTALPEEERATITRILAAYEGHGVQFHALRTRQAAARRFVSLHVLVPGAWTVQRGHELLERIEAEIRAAIPASAVFTHLEPIEDPISFADVPLERSLASPHPSGPPPQPADPAGTDSGSRSGTGTGVRQP